MRPATSARASWSRAPRTTRAPVVAMASAVAAPIPRLAPVTTATRPASQCPRSGTGLRSGTLTGHPPVQPLVSIQAPGQVQAGLGMAPARKARDSCNPADRADGRPQVAGRDQEAGQPVGDHLTERAAPERYHGCPAGLRLGGGHAERLVPPSRVQNDNGAG